MQMDTNAWYEMNRGIGGSRGDGGHGAQAPLILTIVTYRIWAFSSSVAHLSSIFSTAFGYQQIVPVQIDDKRVQEYFPHYFEDIGGNFKPIGWEMTTSQLFL